MHSRRAGRFLVALTVAALAVCPVVASGVASADEGDRECRAGMIVTQGESCTYPGTSDEFRVDSDGRGRFLSFTAGGLLNARSVTVDGRTYSFAAHSQGGGIWTILVVGDPAATGPCANGVAVPDPHKNRGLLNDCNVLLAARDALAGDAGLNWSADFPVAEWEGITTGGSPVRVRRVILGWSGLTGGVPAQLAGLTRLEVLDLHGNRLSGPIPARLAGLTRLEVLDLHGNRLSGPIPAQLGGLTRLEVLDLHGNQLSGTMPLDLGDLASLDLAALDRLSFGNLLRWSITPELGNLVNLESLLLNDNRLTGPIPPALGDLAGLKWLLLYDNQLSGLIPPELGNLIDLEGLYLGGNELSGPIPPELGSLSKLVDLWLHRNQLSGPIPRELGSLSHLYWLLLYKNQLSGPIPPELGNLRQIGLLHLKENRITGCISHRLANRPALQVTHDGLPECAVTSPATPADPTGLPQPAPSS